MNLKSPLSLATVALLASGIVAARADVKAHFDTDALPILQAQPGLLEYVQQNFDVRELGTAKYPGDANHPARPPYIFPARPRGSSGAYSLALLIEPGQPGHILNVVDMTKVHLQGPPPGTMPGPGQPPVATAPGYPQAPAQAQPSAPQAPAVQAPAPTADTPSGPITQPLTPPPDKAPNN